MVIFCADQHFNRFECSYLMLRRRQPVAGNGNCRESITGRP